MNIFQRLKEAVIRNPRPDDSYIPMVRTLPEDFEVDIVKGPDGWSSWPEPSLDSLREGNPDLSELDELIWHAAVVTARTGIPIRVAEGFASTDGVRDNDYYDISVPGCGTGARGFYLAWTLINGIEIGVEAILRRDSNDTLTD